MRAATLSAALLSLVFLGACSSYNVTYDYDVTASYGRYKTFDYYTSKKGTGGTTNLMDKRVRAAVEKELQAKGFVMETKADPDFLVTYYPIVHDRKVRTTTHMGWGWGWGYRPMYGRMGVSSSEVRHYKEGTIVIEIVDFKSNQMIWQGAAAGALTGLNNPEDADEVVPKAVRDILAKFPPK
ncbi:hypothetical protein GETHLI_34280 [Geothrix limicola]|uniref:DUF4136 domain-containing protein n=1 Tax=Geothrix limicola TaxID=2927978 RepID=A0ABQ5QK41_9BACT|nr:DUF4136 domain-containing protein [Geothrix limicola]GLH74926.1 hypothetical protein GETHLI_34280 [Geothrix limicola]